MCTVEEHKVEEHKVEEPKVEEQRSCKGLAGMNALLCQSKGSCIERSLLLMSGAHH